MKPVSAAETEKKPIRRSIYTLKIRLIIRPKETRERFGEGEFRRYVVHVKTYLFSSVES